MTIQGPNGQIVRTSNTEIDKAKQAQNSMAKLIESMKMELARALPKHLSPDRLARLALTAIRTTPKLAECSRESFAGCLMACAALGLEPNTPLGQAYLIPRWSSKLRGQECTLVVGYQGYMDLSRRSGMVSGIQAFPVFAGDVFEYEQGLVPRLRHVPHDGEDREAPEKMTHVYAIVRPANKEHEAIFSVLSRAQVESRRRRGASGTKRRDGSDVTTPWETDYIAMAQKTAVREVFRWAPRSAEMARAEAIESATERGTSVLHALPAETTAGLLGVGIAAPEVDDDGIAVEAEFEDDPKPAATTREPGDD